MGDCMQCGGPAGKHRPAGERGRCRACARPPLAPDRRARLEAGLLLVREMDPEELIGRIAEGLDADRKDHPKSNNLGA